MINFIYDYWGDLLSVCAIIVALVPLLVDSVKVKTRKISANVVDYKFITNAQASNFDDSEKEKGTILLLAVNLFVPYESFFVEEYEIVAKLKSGSLSKAIITDGNLTIYHESGKNAKFIMPLEHDFNLHKEIICERDNIRILEIMLVDTAIESIDSLENLRIVLKNRKVKKDILLKGKDFPNFNKMKFLCEFEKNI